MAFRSAVLAALSLVSIACGSEGGPASESGADAAFETDAAVMPPLDGGAVPEDDASLADADVGGHDAGATSCSDPFRPLLAFDFAGSMLGDDFLSWRRSVVDDVHSVGDGRAVRVRTNPGEELLPACSGGHFFAGRTRLPAPVPQGRTIWLRMYQYIPNEMSFGYKYSRGAGDEDAARACGQSPDGNAWLKWLVLAPDIGTARVYLLPTVTRRALRNDSPRIRLISEALHRPADFDGADLPRDRWFALQMAVRVSDGDDGFIRAWLDDEYLGEVTGPTTVTGASLVEWGLGDYWNGVPWTDGAPGRTDFWIDEIVVASDADGYDVPTGVDSGGRPYIASCTRVADLGP